MHPSNLLRNLSCLLTHEDGLAMSEVMWSVALIAMIAGVALVLGPEVGADWREFVGRPLPHR